MKYALVENDVVVQISFPPVSNWELVDDSVFVGFVRVDGSPGEFINPNPPRRPHPVSQMKELLMSAPAWLRGPYQHYMHAMERLASRDGEGFKELLDSIEPNSSIKEDPDKLEEFNSLFEQLKQIDFLSPLTDRVEGYAD